jgi:hypothetical protein
MELPWPDTTTAPPSIAKGLDSARRFRHAIGIAPPGHDNPVNYSQPHPREVANLQNAIYLSRDIGALTILAVLRQTARLRHKTANILRCRMANQESSRPERGAAR